MIVTVTLNTAIDKTLSVPNFRLGRRHRTVEQTTMPGGKGVNVARVLKTLGAPVIATGLAGGATGTRIVDQLAQLSVLSDFVRIGEESRTNTAVIDPTTGDVIETKTRKFVAGLADEHDNAVQSEKMVEIDFRDGQPIRTGDQFGLGRVTSP